MITEILILIIAGLVVAFVVSLLLTNKRFSELIKREKSEDDQTMKLMRDWIGETRSELKETRKEIQGSIDRNRDSVDRTNKAISERLENASSVIGNVKSELGEIKELGRQMKDLQDFLKSPKLRGNLGEEILKDLLEQVLPVSKFKLQYKFKEGQIVDAIIKTEKGIIPVDSKFPLENFSKMMKVQIEEEKEKYRRAFVMDVKKHISDISKKYILPSEGTVDFAVMYVPSDSIYYEIIMKSEELNFFAREQKVLLVSPNSFYYFMRVVLMGMEGQRIEEQAEKILKTLSTIQQDSKKLEKDLSVLSRHIVNAKNSMDSTMNRYGKLANKIDNVRLLK